MNDSQPETIRVPQSWQTDYTREPVIAVLFGRALTFYRSDDRFISVAHAIPAHRLEMPEDDSVRDVARVALTLHARALLILPGAQDDLWWVRGWPRALSGLLASQGAADEGLEWHPLGGRDLTVHLSAVVFQQVAANGGPARLLTAYFLDTGDPWNIAAYVNHVDEIERPTAVANAWLLAQWALEQRIEFTPSYTGLLAMRASMRRAVTARPDRFLTLPDARRAMFQADNIKAQYFTWLAPQCGPGTQRADAHDPASVHVWTYDRNWSFVSSARRVPIGPPQLTNEYCGKPGVYLISARAPEPDSGRLAPGWFRDQAGNYPAQVSHVWAWQPLIASALREGWRVKVHTGYAWNDSYDLRPWQDHLWMARRTIRHARRHARTAVAFAACRAAEGIIKQVGVSAIGRLNQRTGRVPRVLDAASLDATPLAGRWRDEAVTLDPAEMPSRDMARPEWWNTIVAGAAERLIHLLRSYAGLGVAGYVDAAYLLAPAPEIETDEDTAGGWRLAADELMIPGEALRSNIHTFVTVVARARGAQRAGVSDAN